jgi:hypothetical protein
MKYDERRSNNSMRALITAVIVLVSSVAEAQTRAPWHAAVAPPRAALPAVTVDLGYPGGYVPWESVPITLHATAGDAPFDGYIGFQFRVQEHVAYDASVISRAVLQPHQQWTFPTFARLRRWGVIIGSNNSAIPVPRAVFIDWRDRAAREIAIQNAGTPPWTLWAQPLPLRVTRAGDSARASILGRPAYVAGADALSDRAQWYAGFTDLVVPLDVWLDLPRRVREAIFGSGIHLVLFGFARANQQLDDLDRTLLPVTFIARPGSYSAPWPYRGTPTMPVPAPVSWTAKIDTDKLGGATSPYIVRSGAATWCADEAAVGRAFPAMTVIPLRQRAAHGRGVPNPWPRPAQILRLYPGLLTSLAAVAATIAGWILLRRQQRAGVVTAMLAFAAITLAVRARIRPAAGAYEFDAHVSVAPGIADALQVRRTYGPSPLAEPASDAERMRTSITDADDIGQRYEVRSSDTPMLMGVMQRSEDWNAITRWSQRREMSDGARVRVRHRDGKALMLDFDTPFPVNYVWARWLCGDSVCSGESPVRRGTSGTVTIENGHEVWNEPERFMDDGFMPFLQRSGRSRRTNVVLLDKRSSGSRSLDWLEGSSDERKTSFLMLNQARAEQPGSVSWTFALPAGRIPAGATAFVTLSPRLFPPELTLSYTKGTATLRPTARSKVTPEVKSFLIPSALFRDVLDQGGIVTISMTVENAAEIGSFASARIEVWETKP